MIGATAKSEQFQTRSGSEATKGSRKGFSLLGGGVDPSSVLTPREQRESIRASLVAEMQELALESARLKVDIKKFFGKGDKYFEARKGLVQCQKRMTDLHALFRQSKVKGTLDPADIRVQFMDAARETLTEAQFKVIMNLAAKRVRDSLGDQYSGVQHEKMV